MSRFRVLQFNMQFGQGWDETAPDHAPVRLEATLDELQRHDADIILLQEVERAQPEGVQPNPPVNFTRLRAALDAYDGRFAYPPADPRELPFGLGLAIFSRTPLRDVIRLELPSPPIEFEFEGRKTTPTDRILLGARTTVLGRELRVYNTHLLAFFMLGFSSSDFPRQRTMVAEHVAGGTGPAILGGDFNVRRHHSLIEQYASHGLTTVQDREVTWRRRPYVLDHVFHTAGLRCLGHQVVPTPASDHHALVADFEFV